MSAELSKFAAGIIGIPDMSAYGAPTDLEEGSLVPWVVQRHEADRAGPHHDVRIGKDKMLSFATKKDLPAPGKRIALFPQPLHDESYASFEGEIPEGYGKGKVSTADLGEAYISHVSPRSIKFVTAHKKHPEEFTLVKVKDKGGKDFWLMSNTTPVEPPNFPKVKYKKLPAEEIDKLMDPEYVMSAKIDGAAAFLKLMKDHVQVLSYRADTEGKPIIHTQRMQVAGKMDIPKALQGTTLRGEIWGAKGDEAVPAATLGGLLNATVGNSLRAQAADDIKLKMALFGVKEHGGQEWSGQLQDTRSLIQKAIAALPQEVFHEPPYATTVQEKKKMWKDIKGGKLPMTHEGVVGFPVSGERPIKAKLIDDHDVYIREVFPGEGKYKGKAAGGFYYSMTPDGPIVGKVGTGFSDDERRKMLKNPEEYLGRVARVTAQEIFQSGALRAPAFIALHEDSGPGIKYASEKSTQLSDAAFNVMYHGSPEKLKKIKPMNHHGDPDHPVPLIFATPIRQMALAYTGGKWSDADLSQGGYGDASENPVVELTEMRPNAFKDIYKGKPGYLYKLPADGAEDTGMGGGWEHTLSSAVKPIETEEISDALAVLQSDPNIVMHKFDPSSKEFKQAQKFQAARIRKMSKRMRGHYLKWYFSEAGQDAIAALKKNLKKDFGDELDKYGAIANADATGSPSEVVEDTEEEPKELEGTKKVDNTDVVAQLRKAKKFSDQGRFDLKNAILRKLMLAYPDQWIVDQPDRFRPGVTHVPTQFRLHTDKAFIPAKITPMLPPKTP